MGCAPTRIWRQGTLDRGVWHVSINFDTSNETHQGPPDGTQGYLAACYQNIVDTKPSHFFWSRIRNEVESRIENRKKRNGPNRKSNRLTKEKNIHIPCATLNYYLGWLMGCKVYISYEPFYTNNGAAKFNLLYAISDQTDLLYANFVPTSISPTLYGLLYSVVMFLQQRTKDTGTNNPIDQGVDMYSPWSCCCCCRWVGVALKMTSGRPIKIRIIKY